MQTSRTVTSLSYRNPLSGASRMGRKCEASASATPRPRQAAKTLTIRPDHLGALSDLAVLLTTTGKKDEARQLLQKVLALKPGDPVATANLKSLGG